MPPPDPTGPTGWCKVAFERATELRKSGAIAQQILDDARRIYDAEQLGVLKMKESLERIVFLARRQDFSSLAFPGYVLVLNGCLSR